MNNSAVEHMNYLGVGWVDRVRSQYNSNFCMNSSLRSILVLTIGNQSLESDLEIPHNSYPTRFSSRLRSEIMADLPPESKAIYDLLRAETTEEFDTHFLDYKTEMLDAVHQFVSTTNKQIKTVTASVDAICTAVNTDIKSFKVSIDNNLDAV